MDITNSTWMELLDMLNDKVVCVRLGVERFDDIADAQAQSLRAQKVAYVCLGNGIAEFYAGLIELLGHHFDLDNMELIRPPVIPVISDEVTALVRLLWAIGHEAEAKWHARKVCIVQVRRGDHQLPQTEGADWRRVHALYQELLAQEQKFRAGAHDELTAGLLTALRTFVGGANDDLEIYQGRFPEEFIDAPEEGKAEFAESFAMYSHGTKFGALLAASDELEIARLLLNELERRA